MFRGGSPASGIAAITGGTISGVTGVPVIVAQGRQTAQTATVANLINYTVGASDTSFIVSANVLISTATSFTMFANVTYTDEGNTSRTTNFTFSLQNGTQSTNIGNAAGAVPYSLAPLHIRAKAGTSITVNTTGTLTTVTYNVEAKLQQVM